MRSGSAGWGWLAGLGTAFVIASCTAGTGSRFDGAIDLDASASDGQAIECTRDHDCDDRVACTIEHCVAGRCEHAPCADCCDDGLTCVPGFGCRQAPTPCTMDSDCADSVRCTLDSCRDGSVCAHEPQRELCEAGEICLPAVGCIPEPPTTCTADADCELGAVCVGRWSCQPEFGCQFVSLRDCDDGDGCTVDGCVEEMGGCVHTIRDGDRDGHGDATCGGDDCDDADPAIHPGAVEDCDGGDENCNSQIDEGCCAGGSACTTSCGTAGTLVCSSDGTTRCEPPAEICNGADDDCRGGIDDAFDCARGAVEDCPTSCGTGTRTCGGTCGWGACTPPAEVCNGLDDDCDGPRDEGFACIAGTSSACPTTCGSVGTRACLGDCTFDACVPPEETCNGGDDDCDGRCDDGFTCCQGETRDCRLLGWHAGTAICNSSCGGWTQTACTNCGNGARDTGEQCDGVDLGTATCANIGMGFGGGTLRCAAGCRYDTSSCSRCGNGMIDSGEQCDGSALGGATCSSLGMGFSGGTLRCSSACAFDTSMCTVFNPTGTYGVTPAPSYTCAFGLVNFNGATMSLSVTGTTMTLTMGGLPCSPAGIYNPTTRSFNLTCTAPGTCAETYTLTGMFTTDNQWSGTFRATYVGGSGACFNCANQMWSVTGTR